VVECRRRIWRSHHCRQRHFCGRQVAVARRTALLDGLREQADVVRNYTRLTTHARGARARIGNDPVCGLARSSASDSGVVRCTGGDWAWSGIKNWTWRELCVPGQSPPVHANNPESDAELRASRKRDRSRFVPSPLRVGQTRIVPDTSAVLSPSSRPFAGATATVRRKEVTLATRWVRSQSSSTLDHRAPNTQRHHGRLHGGIRSLLTQFVKSLLADCQ